MFDSSAGESSEQRAAGWSTAALVVVLCPLCPAATRCLYRDSTSSRFVRQDATCEAWAGVEGVRLVGGSAKTCDYGVLRGAAKQ